MKTRKKKRKKRNKIISSELPVPGEIGYTGPE